MDCNELKPGMAVRTSIYLGTTDGLFIKAEYLAARSRCVIGEVLDWVPGHGGDVWWVRHETGEIAAYYASELSLFDKTTCRLCDRPFNACECSSLHARYGWEGR